MRPNVTFACIANKLKNNTKTVHVIPANSARITRLP
jgi:hypothetical protein